MSLITVVVMVGGLVTTWLPPRGVLILVGAAQLAALLPLATAGASRASVATADGLTR